LRRLGGGTGAWDREDRPCLLWWARRAMRTMAVAMIVADRGGTGFLLHTPLGVVGSPRETLVALIGALSRAALAGFVRIVQALPSPSDAAEIEILHAAGFARLTELVYMRLDLALARPFVDSPAVQWRAYGQFTDDELGALIARTYRGSLDCPELCGVRAVADVVAGHKTSGAFRPEAWWIAQRDGESAGCVLVNDSPATGEADVVYVGVAPEHRGTGLCGQMLRRAADQALQRGAAALTLAVDVRNEPARKVYQHEGFRPTQRRVAFVMHNGSDTPKEQVVGEM